MPLDSSPSPTQRKQKGNAKETSNNDPDWVQSEEDLDSNHSGSVDMDPADADKNDDSNHFAHVNMDPDDTYKNEGSSNVRRSMRKNTKCISEMNIELIQTKKELKTVKEELQVLSQVVDKLNKGAPKEVDEAKPRGGRTAVSSAYRNILNHLSSSCFTLLSLELDPISC